MEYFWYRASATHAELNLTECGYQPCTVLDHYRYQAGQAYVFHYVLSGSGAVTIDGRRRAYHAGEWFFFKRGQLVDYGPDAATPWTYAWVAASGSLVDEHLATLTQAALAALPEAKAEQCGRVLTTVAAACRPDNGRELARLAALASFLDVLSAAVALPPQSPVPAPQQQRIDDTLAFLHTHYQEPLTVAGLAQRVNVSRGYLTKQFKAALHVSPQQYLQRLRLARAIQLLETTAMPVQAVAAACGYPDPLYFSTQFKRVYRQSPRAYRRGHSEGGGAG
ncbi:AraC family transcriptional regulator [Lacticaseibacillus suihuaensis]